MRFVVGASRKVHLVRVAASAAVTDNQSPQPGNRDRMIVLIPELAEEPAGDGIDDVGATQ